MNLMNRLKKKHYPTIRYNILKSTYNIICHKEYDNQMLMQFKTLTI